MCLIGFAIGPPGPWLLVVAANRDEFHDRHTAPAAYWGGTPQGLLAGRDLQGGGTWLGLRRVAGDAGLRIGALTNLRPGLMPAPSPPPAGAPAVPPSRGHLVSDFLHSDEDPAEFLRHLEPPASAYAGFNLIAMEVPGAGAPVNPWYLNNLPGCQPRRLNAGLHVLSNATLGVAWPKTRLLHDAMKKALDDRMQVSTIPSSGAGLGQGASRLADVLLDALADRRTAEQADLPSTGLDSERERLLSAPFIVDDHYGTRCSTVVVVSREGQVFFAARSFGPGGRLLGTVAEEFTLRQARVPG